MEEQILQPPQEVPQEPKTKLRQVFDLASWLVLFSLLPFTVLILLSQNSLPGDAFYPVKRGLESLVLAAASVNPSTKAAFRTNLTETRFNEAERLLLSRADAVGLSHFIKEIEETTTDVSALSNQKDSEELTEKLIAKIDEYQNKLIQVQVQIAESNIAYIPPPSSTNQPVFESQKEESTQSPSDPTSPGPTDVSPTQTFPSSAPLPQKSQSTPTPAPASNLGGQTPTSTPIPTAASIAVLLTQAPPTPTKTAIAKELPTNTPIPTVQTPALPPPSSVGSAIDDVQKRLKEIKKELEEKKESRHEKKKEKQNGETKEEPDSNKATPDEKEQKGKDETPRSAGSAKVPPFLTH